MGKEKRTTNIDFTGKKISIYFGHMPIIEYAYLTDENPPLLFVGKENQVVLKKHQGFATFNIQPKLRQYINIFFFLQLASMLMSSQ